MPSGRIPARATLLAAALVACGGLAGCSPSSPPADGASANANLPAQEPSPTFKSDSLAGAGTAAESGYETALAPIHDVRIMARLDGEIVRVDVEEGRRVSAGMVLAKIEDRERRTTLAMRKAEADRAESAWDRADKLHQQKVISDEQHIAARADREIAVARREQALIDVERCEVSTPIGGVVELRRVQLGQMVKEGDLLFQVGDPSTLRAEVLLPESRLGTVRVGQKVRVIPAAGGDPTMARVTRVSPLVDPASGTFRVVVDLDNRAGRLHGGVSARIVFDALPDAPR
jgi:membrane fusion protein, multidrug efflux system